MKKKGNGFTLVELLAVIVILAVILVIAVPQIMDTITESRKGALISSAKLIATSAESAYASNQALGIEKTITCSEVAQINDEDYESCVVLFDDNGKAQVTITGQGKFEGMTICRGTKEDAEAKDSDECPIPAVERIESLAAESNTEGLEKTSDGNLRYTGESPKNYISFNGEDWRIIGIFNVTTSSGKEEKLMKIVRSESIGGMVWDSSASDVNGGWGVNEWSQADLQTTLNTYYIGTSATCSYCGGTGQETCSDDCSSSVTPIESTYESMIEEVVWNTGAFIDGTTPVLTAYNEERGTTTGKTCSGGTYCNDTVERTTEWQGKVGLIYPSDYGYASTDTSCRENISDSTNYPCKNTNWLHSGSNYWTLSPCVGARFAWHVNSSGYAGGSFAGHAWYMHGVRPTIYLKSNISITSGKGTVQKPYKLSV